MKITDIENDFSIAQVFHMGIIVLLSIIIISPMVMNGSH